MDVRRLVSMCLLAGMRCYGQADGALLREAFAAEVDLRLEIPVDDQRWYGLRLATLGWDGRLTEPQYVVLVDRNPLVQAVMIYWFAPGTGFQFLGASPVSTGKPGTYDHFQTPLGIVEHSVANLDFRAEGTRNENGILGYGRKGMRVYDFGWQKAERGWGRGGESPIRLLMHATDPGILSSRLGSIQSKGCIRIPAALNTFIDRYGILDGDYERAMAAGQKFWMLSKSRTPTPGAGRFLAILDSERTSRPAWSPEPGTKR